MNDGILLEMFRRNEPVKPEDIMRRLILCERSYHPEINDNLFQKAAEHYVTTKGSHAAFFTEGLQKLSRELLVQENDHLRVKKEMMGCWHESLTYCSPLLLLAAWSTDTLTGNFVDKGIVHTALIPPSEIKSLLGDVRLYDLHLHLNGSTEIDVMWQDALRFPEKYHEEFEKALRNQMVVEQVEQQYPRLNEPTELYQLLLEARSIRWFIVHELLRSQPTSKTGVILNNPARDYSSYQDKDNHPLSRDKSFYSSISSSEASTFLQYEYWFYVLVFRQLNKLGSHPCGAELAKWFHYYLLILGLMNRMVVQQTDQYGFRQFQKITVNDLRRNSEQEYQDRFLQLLTVDGEICQTHVARLEGRFAPKVNTREIFNLLQKIDKGLAGIGKLGVSCALTAHFIKRPVDEGDSYRFDKVRSSLWESCIALDSILSDSCACKSLHLEEHPVVAIDAASSEFDTPPEVFAPVFRYLRARHKELQFTYHAGEDFYHPLSGLRAIFETVTFLSYREYDRIGHATALGIDPVLWFHRMPSALYLSKEEWLDDLLFCLFILELHPSPLYNSIVQLIDLLNGGKKDLCIMTQAWLARHWDPDCIEGDFLTIDHHKKEELSAFQKQALSDEVKTALNEHWKMRYFAALNEPVLVDDSVISADVIRLVQKKLMEVISSKGIYLEALPTSNLRISIYKNYSEHHIKNWIDGGGIQDRPHVVLGTDDPGIFATNIIYEYSHVSQVFGPASGKDVISKIVKDSEELIGQQVKENGKSAP